MPFIRSESCSFIWHPKVVTWKRFGGARMAVGRVPPSPAAAVTAD